VVDRSFGLLNTVNNPVSLAGLEGEESNHVHPPRVANSAYTPAHYNDDDYDDDDDDNNNNNNNNSNKFLIMNMLAQLDTRCRILKNLTKKSSNKKGLLQVKNSKSSIRIVELQIMKQPFPEYIHVHCNLIQYTDLQ